SNVARFGVVEKGQNVFTLYTDARSYDLNIDDTGRVKIEGEEAVYSNFEVVKQHFGLTQRVSTQQYQGQIEAAENAVKAKADSKAKRASLTQAMEPYCEKLPVTDPKGRAEALKNIMQPDKPYYFLWTESGGKSL